MSKQARVLQTRVGFALHGGEQEQGFAAGLLSRSQHHVTTQNKGVRSTHVRLSTLMEQRAPAPDHICSEL